MIRLPPRSTLVPYTTLFLSTHLGAVDETEPARQPVEEQVLRDAELGDERELLVDHGEAGAADRKSTRLNSSHANISYAVFCLNKKITKVNFIIYFQICIDHF